MENIVVEPFSFNVAIFTDKGECMSWVIKEKQDSQDLLDNIQSSLGIFGKLEVNPTTTKFFIYYDNDSTLDHEIIHATWYLLEHAGVDISYDNHEIQAYLFEHIKRLITSKNLK